MTPRLLVSVPLLLACSVLTGCVAADANGPQTWAVTVETSDIDLHGVTYDYDANTSIAAGMVFVNGVPVSVYPDLYVAVIAEDGVYAQGEEEELKGECDNLLKCEVVIDVPSGYFMLVVLDLDLFRVDKHDYIDGRIFTDRPRGIIDDDRVAAVENSAREWMDSRVEGVPKRPFSVVRRRDCRAETCSPDGLGGTASLDIAPLPNQARGLTETTEDATTSADQN